MRAFVEVFVRFGLAAFLVSPLTVILHELGHWFAGLALGFDVRLRAASVSGGAELGQAPGWMVAAQAAAGPLVTLLLILLGIALVIRRGASSWAVALAATAPLRFFVGISYLALSVSAWFQGGVLRGSPNFDEYNAAMGIGLPLLPWLAAELVLVLWTWGWLVRRIGRGRRLGAALGIGIGAALGLFAWLSLLGPKLLSG